MIFCITIAVFMLLRALFTWAAFGIKIWIEFASMFLIPISIIEFVDSGTFTRSGT